MEEGQGYYLYQGGKQEVPRDVIHVRVDESVKEIPARAFFNRSHLLTIQLPRSLESIGDSAFSHCSSLTMIDLPENLQSIGRWVFSHCSSLTAIDLPRSLEMIGDSAFYECSSLATIDFPKSLKSIGGWAFAHCSFITTIHLPDALEHIGDEAFSDCRLLLAVQLSTSSTTELQVKNGAFARCPLLSAIQFAGPESRIAEDAFKECEMLNQGIHDGEEDARGFVVNRWTDLPLHRACFEANPSRGAIIHACEECPPNKLDAGDRVGMTALHLLVLNRKATKDMVMALVEKCPALLRRQDSQKMTPLHCACYNRETNQEIIDLLCDHLHEGRQMSAIPDTQGDAPAALAIRHFGPKNSIALHLYKRHPVKAQELKTDKEGEILKEISSRYIETLKKSKQTLIEDYSRYEQDGWVAFVLDPPEDDVVIGACVAFIRTGKTAHVLAYSKDFYGRVALDVAVGGIKKALQERVLFRGRYDIVKGPPLHESPSSMVMKALDKKTDEEYKKVFEEAIRGRDHDKLSKEDVKRFLEEKLDIQYGINQGALDLWDRDKDGQISLEEFVKFCMSDLVGGGERWVVIKFLTSEKEYRREIANREKLDPKFVVRYIDNGDIPSSRGLEGNIDDCTMIMSPLELALAGWTEEGMVLCGHYKHFIVMPFADKNLDTIFRSERPEPVRVRSLTKSLAKGLQSIHEVGIIHGDLKLLNLVRVNGNVQLIDFDASAREGDFIGVKFSSGVLPPEMFVELTTEEEYNKYREYLDCDYSDSLGDGSPPIRKGGDWSRKEVKPKKGRGSEYFGVKTFVAKRVRERDISGENLGDEKDVPVGSPPFTLVRATPAIDIWSFGVILYTLWMNAPLFTTDAHDNLVKGSDMEKLCEWDNERQKKVLQHVEDDTARDLLENLLCPPEDRYQSMDEVLKHSFYSGKHPRDEQTKEIQATLETIVGTMKKKVDETFIRMSNERATKLKELQRVLLMGIFEANEVQTPTSFVILNRELPTTETPSSPEWQDVLKENGEGFDGSAAVDVVTKNPKWRELYDYSMKWVRKSSNLIVKLQQEDVSALLDEVKNSIEDLLVEKMYLYLVDELTGKPVPEAKYEITTPTELVPVILPCMIWTMRAVSLCNGVSGLVRMFGFPFPEIPGEWREEGQQTVELLKQKSSVEQFGSIQGDVDEAMAEGATQEVKRYRGAALRRLSDFLISQNDRTFGGLNRYFDERTGVAMWSLCKNKREFDRQLEERLNERNVEAQREFASRESLQRELEKERQRFAIQRCELENERNQRQLFQDEVAQLQTRLDESNGQQNELCWPQSPCVIS